MTVADLERTTPFAIVAIGSSAGGIYPLGDLLAALPKDAPLTVIVVQHLSASRPSQLVEVLQSRSQLPVENIQSGQPLRRGVVYVTPPGYDVIYEAGCLQLLVPPQRISPAPSIDQLFSSLAASPDAARSIAIILSGLGTDGAVGVHALRRTTAVVIVQSPLEASSPNMPEAALASGGVHATADILVIASRLVSLATALLTPTPLLSDSERAHFTTASRRWNEMDLSRFSPSLLSHFVHRRRALVGARSTDAYITLLQEDPAELGLLLSNLLNPLGSFDAQAPSRQLLISELRRRYLAWRGPGTFRAWCVGCATGEEAYAMAFALDQARTEHPEAAEFSVYGTDALSDMVSIARSGTYAEHELQGLPGSSVTRFLTRRLRHYQVRHELRRKLLFSVHDALSDSPLPQQQFIVCQGITPLLQEQYARQLQLNLLGGLASGGCLLMDDVVVSQR
jgi:two-component system, chemotaxis family, CheB/CheR fusion protein